MARLSLFGIARYVFSTSLCTRIRGPLHSSACRAQVGRTFSTGNWFMTRGPLVRILDGGPELADPRLNCLERSPQPASAAVRRADQPLVFTSVRPLDRKGFSSLGQAMAVQSVQGKERRFHGPNHVGGPIWPVLAGFWRPARATSGPFRKLRRSGRTCDGALKTVIKSRRHRL